MDDQFLAAKSAKGTRLLSVNEASEFSRHCVRRGWVIQSMEAFEVSDMSERLELGFSMLGLTNEERSQSADPVFKFVQRRLEKARNSCREIRFQIWIDKNNKN